VNTRPRYAELLARREEKLPFSDEDVRDLCALFNLSWLGFAARAGDRDLGRLDDKGRGYTSEEIALVHQKQRAACARVLPLYRELAERGQIELSSSPFYHPIVPLLVDSDTAHRALPHASLPQRFQHPDDAEAQVKRAKDLHARTFGAAPRGMWPPEGSISPEAVAVYARAGVRWLASDEGNLWRSFDAEPHGRGDLFRAYCYGGVDLVFRDRELSDKIGFHYARLDADRAVADLLASAKSIAAASTAPSDEPALVPIFLDGENPWEAYPGAGEPFLRSLFSALSTDATLKTASVAGHLDEAKSRRTLRRLHSGSWIDSDFHIWIGDPVKNRAWELLGRARNDFQRASASDSARAAAYERLLAAEGSDWFWWFGEPFSSMEDALFDALFRAHLAGVYEALGITVPAFLVEPVAPYAVAAAARQTPPFSFVSPTLGGHHFYDWFGAGTYRVPRGAAMAENPLCAIVRFGFDRSTLYLRLEPSDDKRDALLAARIELDVRVAERRLALPESEIKVARERVIELALPFARVGAKSGDSVEIEVQLLPPSGAVPLQRIPSDGPLRVLVPGAEFEAANWSV
jgi:alpha-amylase/alpha-mannosidase (GH57 family)